MFDLDINELIQRNTDHLQRCVENYKFNCTYEELLNFANVFASSNIVEKTVRIIAETKSTPESSTDEDAGVITKGLVKYIKTPICSLTKRSHRSMREDDIDNSLRDLSLVDPYLKQLKYLRKIEEVEVEIKKRILKIEHSLEKR